MINQPCLKEICHLQRNYKFTIVDTIIEFLDSSFKIAVLFLMFSQPWIVDRLHILLFTGKVVFCVIIHLLYKFQKTLFRFVIPQAFIEIIQDLNPLLMLCIQFLILDCKLLCPFYYHILSI